MFCYLNNATEGWPKAPHVVAEVARALRAAPRLAGRSPHSDQPAVEDCRRKLSAFLGTPSPAWIAFFANATAALNTAIFGLGLKKGDVVVTTVAAHNSVLRPLLRLARGIGVDLRIIDAAPGDDQFDTALRDGARLVVLPHVSNVTGEVAPVRQLFAKARQHGAHTLLDACQSVGHLSVKPSDTLAAMTVFNSSKGLHGPPGAGVLCVEETTELTPTLVGGSGINSASADMPSAMPARLEAGTPNAAALAGLSAALDWHAKNHEQHNARSRRRLAMLREGLAAIAGVELQEPASEAVGMVSFRARGWDPASLADCLASSFSIVGRAGLHCAPRFHRSRGSFPDGTLRLSVSGFSQKAHIAWAIRAVREICECT